EDPEEAVEVSGDLRDEWRHVGRTERNAGRLDNLAAVLLDLLKIRIPCGLAPRVVEIGDVPFLAHLVDQVRSDGNGLGRRVVEGPEDVPAALSGCDRGVQADTDHPYGLVLLEDRHAGQADVREVAALGDVNLVLENNILRLAAPDVGRRLVVGDDQLDGASVDAARLVDPLDGHLRADQGGLPARRARAGERLAGGELVGVWRGASLS